MQRVRSAAIASGLRTACFTSLWLLPAVLAGTLIFRAQDSLANPKPGSEKARWPIKTSLAPNAKLTSPTVIPLKKLLTFDDPPDVKKKDKRYQHTLIPHY